MTATLDTGLDWRHKAVCDAGSYDTHFADVETLIEDEGMNREDAESIVEMAEATAKAICSGCPVRDACRDWALTNDEDWGIWGGMNPSERNAHRKLWLEIKGLEGATIEPIVVRDQDALHRNPGSAAKLAQRNERCRIGRDKLLQLPKDWSTPKTRKDKARTRDEYLEICELVLANPDSIPADIAARQGKTDQWLLNIIRVMRIALDIA